MKHIVVTIVMIGIVINASLYQINRFADRIVEEDFSKVADWYSYGSMQHFANREFAKLENEEREKIAKEYDDMTYENNNFDEDLVYNYFSYDIEDNLFYKYIARTKITDKLDKR